MIVSRSVQFRKGEDGFNGKLPFQWSGSFVSWDMEILPLDASLVRNHTEKAEERLHDRRLPRTVKPDKSGQPWRHVDGNALRTEAAEIGQNKTFKYHKAIPKQLNGAGALWLSIRANIYLKTDAVESRSLGEEAVNLEHFVTIIRFLDRSGCNICIKKKSILILLEPLPHGKVYNKADMG